MLIYILKFSACLFIFMAFYKLFLERETMHQLKRFYLLFALVLSIGFPLITFTQFVEPITITQNFTNTQQITLEHEAIEQTSLWDYLPQLLWTIYGVGVLIFSLKFLLFLFINFFILMINYYVDNKNKFFFVVPFVVFLSSILAPIIFFIISDVTRSIFNPQMFKS